MPHSPSYAFSEKIANKQVYFAHIPQSWLAAINAHGFALGMHQMYVIPQTSVQII